MTSQPNWLYQGRTTLTLKSNQLQQTIYYGALSFFLSGTGCSSVGKAPDPKAWCNIDACLTCCGNTSVGLLQLTSAARDFALLFFSALLQCLYFVRLWCAIAGINIRRHVKKSQSPSAILLFGHTQKLQMLMNGGSTALTAAAWLFYPCTMTPISCME